MRKFLDPWLIIFLSVCLLITIVSLFVVRINDLNNIARDDESRSSATRRVFCEFMHDRSQLTAQPGDSPIESQRNQTLADDAARLYIKLGCTP